MTHSTGYKPNPVRQIVALAVTVVVLSITASEAPSQTAKRPAFEVASVKPNKTSGDPRDAIIQAMSLQYLPGGRFSARSVPVPVLIFEAYGAVPGPSGRIILSPEFEKSMDRRLESETYDIEAIADKGAIPANASPSVQRETLRLMLQNLLEDRFKVRIRQETKDVPVYAMVVGKSGPKFQKSTMDDTRCTAISTDLPLIVRMFYAADAASCHSFAGGPTQGWVHGELVDMPDLAMVVERFSDRPVVDHTGLTGFYKIAFPAWNLRRPTGPDAIAEKRDLEDASRPTMTDALQDLGLRLESAKAPVEMFVVEHFERPAQN
jgi:uncharacterized protein (TIGR03435 family)